MAAEIQAQDPSLSDDEAMEKAIDQAFSGTAASEIDQMAESMMEKDPSLSKEEAIEKAVDQAFASGKISGAPFSGNSSGGGSEAAASIASRLANVRLRASRVRTPFQQGAQAIRSAEKVLADPNATAEEKAQAQKRLAAAKKARAAAVAKSEERKKLYQKARSQSIALRSLEKAAAKALQQYGAESEEYEKARKSLQEASQENQATLDFRELLASMTAEEAMNELSIQVQQLEELEQARKDRTNRLASLRKEIRGTEKAAEDETESEEYRAGARKQLAKQVAERERLLEEIAEIDEEIEVVEGYILSLESLLPGGLMSSSQEDEEPNGKID